jgi:hypothetical protein
MTGWRAASAAALLSAACSTGGACAQASTPSGACADIDFNGDFYDEWREMKPPPIMQEVGDASYPVCNASSRCTGDDLGGLGSTDVWVLEGVDPAKALIGLREGTSTYVVFVRVGTDPASVKAAMKNG